MVNWPEGRSEARARREGGVVPQHCKGVRRYCPTLSGAKFRVFERYHLLQLIGQGGMGEVWLADQKQPVRRRVAIKLIKAGMDTREVVARFESERQALALHNLESQRRQYGLTARAQQLGFRDVEVIDEDLGRSGSGCEDRPGFERLVTQVCSGDVGGVICVEASRLARNGRDWHRLIRKV